MITFDDNSIMPVGVHKGNKLANVPAQHLLWRLENNLCFGALKKYIEENKPRLELEVKHDRKNRYR